AKVLVIPEKVKEELQGDEKVLKPEVSNPLEEQYKEEERKENLITIISEKPKEQEKEKEKEEEEEEIMDSVSAFQQYSALRPRGMRILHARQNAVLLEPRATIELKGKLGKIHQNIFDSQKFQNVTFKKFKTLWKHICGNNSVIESNGSSHKKLVGPYGEVFGTYAHSDSMTYGLRTIKYIRDALIQIGYGD
ncbi:MAG: hypothetical protein IBJ00_05390, partial [Alphaproteobacteria bacterium]|nr:hypothetical protein [Alphaproteobacteria bacterium]